MVNESSRRARRKLIGFLAASPVLALGGLPAALARAIEPRSALYPELLAALSRGETPIASPEAAINVFDFDVAARARLSPAHYGYLATGTDNDATVLANRQGFDQIQLRARRLTGIEDADCSLELFGTRWNLPVALSPVGNERAFHAQGAIAAARAAREQDTLQILAAGSNFALADVHAARGAPVWFQLYPADGWPYTQAVVKRAEDAGCPVLVLTVDLAAGHNRESLERFRRLDDGDCSACHLPRQPRAGKYPNVAGIAVARDAPPLISMNWELVDRLRQSTTMKLVIKGIVTREDAALCIEHGVAGIIVSNHGGRAENSGRSTIECLPEVVEAVGGRIPVLIDGGFRRGTDIFKALALGARAVCVGRPWLWGLAAFGEPGVGAVLGILRRELELVMRQCGAATLKEIDRRFVI